MNLLWIILLNIYPLSYWSGGPCKKVIQKDSLLYVISGGTVFFLRDFSDGLPEIKKEFSMPGKAYSFDFTKDTIGVAGEFGFYIYNISIPLYPQIIGKYTKSKISSVSFIYPYAYGVKDGNLILFDLISPYPPESVNYFYFPGNITKIKIYNDIGFALAEDTLYILNLQTPQNPSIYSKLSFPGEYLEDLVKKGNDIFISIGVYVKIYSISDPYNPSFIDEFQVSGYAEELSLSDSGDTMIIALSFSGVGSYDISDYSNVYEIYHNYYITNAISVVKTNSPYVFVCDLSRGLFSLTYPNLQVADSIAFPEITYNSELIKDSILVLCSGKGGLWFIDVGDKENPYLVAHFDIPGSAMDVESYNDTVIYVASLNEGVRVYSVKSLSNIYEYSYIITDGTPVALSINFPYLYAARGSGGGFSILEISDPTKIREVNGVTTSGNAQDVLFYAPYYLFVADGYEGVHIYDISDTSNPYLVTTLTSYGSSQALDVNNGTLVVAEGWSGGITLWDIQDPTSPSFISNYNTPGFAMDVIFMHPDTLIVADGMDYGIRKIDVTDPYNPSEVSYYVLSGEPRGIFQDSSTLYVSIGNLGVSIVDPYLMTIKEGIELVRDKNVFIYDFSFLEKEALLFSIDGRKIKKIKKGVSFGIVKSDNRIIKILRFK